MKKIISPRDIIARALNCDVKSLSKNSGYNNHPAWDSLGQLSVIAAIESYYGIEISNEDILKYSTLKSIVELNKKHKE